MLGELTNHMWQSTVFAVVIALLAICFRKDRAQVRYWLWLSASLKFLLPFSLLIALGSRFERVPAAQSMRAKPAVKRTVAQVSQPVPDVFMQAPVAQGAHNWAAIAIFGVWGCGFAAISLMRFRAWRRIRAAIRHSKTIDPPAGIEVRSSPGLLEPGIVGLFRPVLLLPEGAVERLKPAQMQAVLAHEMCHVRRHDNLTSAIHMIVEAMFWFYPLVWWIGARLVEERERACDEAVLRLGTQPRDYVEGILNICKSYLASPLPCVSGVTGSELKKRIRAILTGPEARELNFSRKLALTVAAAAALLIPIAAGVVTAPKFEAVSIKSCATFRKSNVRDFSPGMFHSECTTVDRLIQQAYGLFADGHMNPGSSLMVSGGPSWTKSDLYKIDAKAENPENRAMMNGPMLQTVLEDKFKLTFHRETRPIPVYTLTVASGGPQLDAFQGSCTPRDFDKPPSPSDCATAHGFGNGFELKAATIGNLCAGLSIFLNRQVIDKTGVAGRFNMHLDLSDKSARALPALSDPTAPPPPPVSFQAAKEALKKLGLELEPAKGPVEVLVIDHVEKPAGG